MTTEALITALDAVTHYNGLDEFIVKWKEPGYLNDDGYSLTPNYYKLHLDERSIGQLEIFWMICVMLFGDYGTSPRSGWIESEKKEDFYEFIDTITETYRERIQLEQEG